MIFTKKLLNNTGKKKIKNENKHVLGSCSPNIHVRGYISPQVKQRLQVTVKRGSGPNCYICCSKLAKFDYVNIPKDHFLPLWL